MKLLLLRSYYPTATNGQLYIDTQKGLPVLYSSTIEREWEGNKSNRSCIPEGTYRLRKRFSAKHNWHLEVTGVPDRGMILIHPANNEQTELLGCIAPVEKLYPTPGTGGPSRKITEALYEIVFAVLDRGENVFLTIGKADEKLS